MMTEYLYLLANDKISGGGHAVIKFFLWIMSLFYGLGIRLRAWLYKVKVLPSTKVDTPVISVGNITLGGVGKTPTVIYIAEKCKQMGKKPAILIRGYMQDKLGVDFSDEANVLKEWLGDVPVLVGKNRIQNVCKHIEDNEVDVFVMDDGFQHQQLVRNLDIVAIDATNPFGNGDVLPRGILREPKSSLKRADLCMLTKCDLNEKRVAGLEGEIKDLAGDISVVKSKHAPQEFVNLKTNEIHDLSYGKQKEVALLCSIGSPKGFQKTVENLDSKVVKRFFYIDHYVYTQDDVDRVQKACIENGIKTVITTQKDAVKLYMFKDKLSDELEFLILKIQVNVYEGEDILVERINSLL